MDGWFLYPSGDIPEPWKIQCSPNSCTKSFPMCPPFFLAHWFLLFFRIPFEHLPSVSKVSFHNNLSLYSLLNATSLSHTFNYWLYKQYLSFQVFMVVRWREEKKSEKGRREREKQLTPVIFFSPVFPLSFRFPFPTLNWFTRITHPHLKHSNRCWNHLFNKNSLIEI